ETQEELCKLLQKDGYDVTQATVSRDIQHLRLIKVKSENKYKYVVMEKLEGEKEKFVRVMKEGFKSLEVAKNIIVVKTMIGMANAVAAAIDSLCLEGVVGSLAGDDTIFLVLKDDDMAMLVSKKIDMLMHD
ncbi:MAG: arginine repressor, partial [Lachnospiraceae bacterium]|nr:arginine repressor [Lachnospiraceae bacterium]